MESEKKDSALVRSSAAEYLTFVASTGEDKDSIEMRYEDENIWLTQKMMATLYDVGLPTINEHIKKIYADHEQDEAATIRKFRIVPLFILLFQPIHESLGEIHRRKVQIVRIGRIRLHNYNRETIFFFLNRI